MEGVSNDELGRLLDVARRWPELSLSLERQQGGLTGADLGTDRGPLRLAVPCVLRHRVAGVDPGWVNQPLLMEIERTGASSAPRVIDLRFDEQAAAHPWNLGEVDVHQVGRVVVTCPPAISREIPWGEIEAAAAVLPGVPGLPQDRRFLIHLTDGPPQREVFDLARLRDVAGVAVSLPTSETRTTRIAIFWGPVSRASLKQVAAHELVHAVSFLWGIGVTNANIAEGLAIWGSTAGDFDLRPILRSLDLSGELEVFAASWFAAVENPTKAHALGAAFFLWAEECVGAERTWRAAERWWRLGEAERTLPADLGFADARTMMQEFVGWGRVVLG